MNRILFVDVTCPQLYDGNTLTSEPQGGSESTLTRVAEALVKKGNRVRVTQHNRSERAEINGVEYTPLRQNADFSATHVVAFRDASTLDSALKLWPSAKGYAWYQDFPRAGAPFAQEAEALTRHRGTAILVSDWHEEMWTSFMRYHGFAGRMATKRIYNPIPDDLNPDSTPVDPDKFLFFSSPHKGLRRTLEVFSRFQEYPELRDVRLHVANPGYLKMDLDLQGGRVVDLGPLSWPRVIQELRSAFLVFHYNPVYPETFGLVHAEADAVGTPWIGGTLGANPEVYSHPDEIADLADPESVLERIIVWKTHGRIEVRAREEFRISKIVGEWEDLFASS